MNPGRIVNGIEVYPPRKYPYMVAMTPMRCGGSLVAPNVVLTAAHCGASFTGVQIGRHDLANPNESYETLDVLENVPHPNYNVFTDRDYDFMLVRLSGNSAFEPVELDDSGTLPNDSDLIVMGWGAICTGCDSADVLMEVNVQSDSSCGYYPPYKITDRMFCAGDVEKDSCQGDSGGPIIGQESGKLVGVVSWGLECADPNYPGVYARVNNQLPWIQSYIDAWSTPTPIPTPNPTPIPTKSPAVDISLCDWGCYIARYQDLSAGKRPKNSSGVSVIFARRHYKNTGAAEGRDCTCGDDVTTTKPTTPADSEVCNWPCYLDRYEELREKFGDNTRKARLHYRKIGAAQGLDCTC